MSRPITDLTPGQEVKVFARAGEPQYVEFGTRDNGTPYLAIPFELRAGQAYEGWVYYYQNLETDDNFRFAWESLRACGVTSDTFEDLTGVDSKEVRLTVRGRSYTAASGEVKRVVDVAFVNPIGVVKNPMKKADLAAISARARAHALASKPKGKAPASAVGPGDAPPPPPPEETPPAPPPTPVETAPGGASNVPPAPPVETPPAELLPGTPPPPPPPGETSTPTAAAAAGPGDAPPPPDMEHAPDQSAWGRAHTDDIPF